MSVIGKDSVWIGNDDGSMGAWLDLPYAEEVLDAFLREKVGVDPAMDEYRVFDTSFEGPLGVLGIDAGLSDHPVHELNILATLCSDLTDEQLIASSAVIDETCDTSITEFCNVVAQADDINYVGISETAKAMPEAPSERAVGYAMAEKAGGLGDLPRETLERFFDFDAYGRALMDEGKLVGDVYIGNLQWDIDPVRFDISELDAMVADIRDEAKIGLAPSPASVAEAAKAVASNQKPEPRRTGPALGL